MTSKQNGTKFYIMSKRILSNLLLYQSSKVVGKAEIDFNKELLNRHPNDYKEKRIAKPLQKAQRLQKQIRKTAIEKMEKDRGETTRKPYQ